MIKMVLSPIKLPKKIKHCFQITSNSFFVFLVCRCLGIPCRMITVYDFPPNIQGTSIKLDIIDGMISEKCKDTVSIYSMFTDTEITKCMKKP